MGNSYVSDFIYLTKCSDEWYVVFIENENPKKRIFTEDNHFTADFNHAYEQVQDWERYFKNSENRTKVLASLKNICHSKIMRNNNVSFKYLLIYGRGDERNKSNARRNMFLGKKINDIKCVLLIQLKVIRVSFLIV